MIGRSLDRYRDEGLLALRIGIGVMFVLHGFPKISGGPEVWTKIGMAMGALGITFAPAFWGFMAASAEFGGGLLLVLGLLTRPASLLLLSTMIVATVMHVKAGDGMNVYSHALEAAILFFSLLFIGPGRLSLDEVWARKAGTTKDDSNG